MTASVAEESEMLLERRTRHVARGVTTAHPIFAVRAQGSSLWDASGKEYLDFTGGLGVLNVGHNHPKVVQAIKAELDRVTHTCFQVAMYESYVRLAERLNVLAGLGAPTKTILLTTGVEATENAIKISRAYTNRPAVLAFSGGFHGRTLMGMTLTATNHSYRQNFGPFAPEVYHLPYPYEYRGWSTEKAVAAIFEFFHTRVAPEHVAAVIIEPQLGEGGFVPAPPEFLAQLRHITQTHGIVLILDEIQSGFGRTGKMFAFQHSGIVPDVVTVAKSLAAGLPLSAVIGRAEIVDAPLPGGLGGTYAGNPLACAAALAVLDVFEQEKILESGERQGHQLRAGLLKLQECFSQIGDVRGTGAMLGVELVKNREDKQPDADLADRVLDRARQYGLLIIKCGIYKNVIRFLAPLVATPAQISEGLRRLESAFRSAVQ
jgi:4-aminobutyrate aminotransferase/(S)-3-amino-2-methylpropionate transaminase